MIKTEDKKKIISIFLGIFFLGLNIIGTSVSANTISDNVEASSGLYNKNSNAIVYNYMPEEVTIIDDLMLNEITDEEVEDELPEHYQDKSAIGVGRGINKNTELSDEQYTFTLLLNNTANIDNIEALLYEMNSSFILTTIDEIKLIQIESEELIDIDRIISNKGIYEATIEYGQLAEIEQESITLTDICSDSSMVPIEDAANEVNLDVDNLELLSSLSWHVDDVTASRKSLDISTGQDVDIALIDSGIDYLHPLLIDKINLSDAKSYIPEDQTLNDANGHGTMVAGVIAQISPDAKITPYRVIGESSGETLWTIEAIVQATNDGKDVINMSLGTYKSISDSSQNLTIKAFERAVDYAASKGAILVSSAGNKGLNLDVAQQDDFIRHLPGSLEGVIAISSTTRGRELASYSNYGSNIHFTAPGGDIILVNGRYDLAQWIYTTYPTSVDNGLSILGIPQGYMFSYGTSLSAPAMTAGIASFMTQYKEMTGEAASKDVLLEYFKNNSLDLGTSGYDIYFGNGQINIYNALSEIEDELPPSGQVIDSIVEINTCVSAKDLVSNISDNNDNPEDISIYFDKAYYFDTLGEKAVVVVLEDMAGNKANLSVNIKIIDSTPPIGKPQKCVVEQDAELDASQLVKEVHDNAGDDQVVISLITDVDTSQLGTYSVVISLKDQSGNETIVESEVEIIAKSTTIISETNVKPNESADNAVSGKVNKTNAFTPNTGDHNNPYLLIGTMIICGFVVYIIPKKKRYVW